MGSSTFKAVRMQYRSNKQCGCDASGSELITVMGSSTSVSRQCACNTAPFLQCECVATE
jgi:hypothetical protein